MGEGKLLGGFKKPSHMIQFTCKKQNHLINPQCRVKCISFANSMKFILRKRPLSLTHKGENKGYVSAFLKSGLCVLFLADLTLWFTCFFGRWVEQVVGTQQRVSTRWTDFWASRRSGGPTKIQNLSNSADISLLLLTSQLNFPLFVSATAVWFSVNCLRSCPHLTCSRFGERMGP